MERHRSSGLSLQSSLGKTSRHGLTYRGRGTNPIQPQPHAPFLHAVYPPFGPEAVRRNNAPLGEVVDYSSHRQEAQENTHENRKEDDGRNPIAVLSGERNEHRDDWRSHNQCTTEHPHQRGLESLPTHLTRCPSLSAPRCGRDRRPCGKRSSAFRGCARQRLDVGDILGSAGGALVSEQRLPADEVDGKSVEISGDPLFPCAGELHARDGGQQTIRFGGRPS